MTLPIKKKWFDMILSGEKKEEYREIKPYYDSRFERYLPNFCGLKIFPYEGGTGFISVEDEIVFRNGYRKDSPKIKCKVKVKKGYGKPEWGATPGELYYVLEILSVEEVKNND